MVATRLLDPGLCPNTALDTRCSTEFSRHDEQDTLVETPAVDVLNQSSDRSVIQWQPDTGIVKDVAIDGV